MNSDEEAIKFFASYVFKYQMGAEMDFKASIWPYLRFFLTKDERATIANVDTKYIHCTGGYKRIWNLFCFQIKAKHGRECIRISKRESP